jgi:hypothetical protein
MTTIETTAHVGSDGVLRLEVPTGQADQDVDVVLVIHRQQPAPAVEGLPELGTAVEPLPPDPNDPWRDLRKKLAGVKGITIPAPGSWNLDRPEPLFIDDGRSASDMLVEDRR